MGGFVLRLEVELGLDRPGVTGSMCVGVACLSGEVGMLRGDVANGFADKISIWKGIYFSGTEILKWT